MYLSLEEYKELGGIITDDKTINKFLKQGERYIDILTFNRLRSFGFDNCSNWEKEILKESLVEIIDFHYSNQEYINSYLSSYSLNGVSISFDNVNNNVTCINNIVLPSSTYAKITGTRFGSLVL